MRWSACHLSVYKSNGPCVTHYGRLQMLVLDGNRMTELPMEIGALKKLEKLSASENALTGLPASVSALTSLTVLKLANNKLSAVPEQLGACSSLEELDLADNYLQASEWPDMQHTASPSPYFHCAVVMPDTCAVVWHPSTHPIAAQQLLQPLCAGDARAGAQGYLVGHATTVVGVPTD